MLYDDRLVWVVITYQKAKELRKEEEDEGERSFIDSERR